MLPRIYRLPAATRLRRPRSIHTALFLLKYAVSPVSHSRVGIVVSKKVDKRAVRRNHLRRVVMHALQPLLPQMPTPYDLVFIVKGNSGDVTDKEIGDAVAATVKELPR